MRRTHLFLKQLVNALPQLQHGQQHHGKAVNVAALVIAVASNDLRRDVQQRAHLIRAPSPIVRKEGIRARV